MKRIFQLALVAFVLAIPPSLEAADLLGTTCPGAGCSDIRVSGRGAVGIQISAYGAGTITFSASSDNINFVVIQVQNSTTGAIGSTATGTGIFTTSVAGYAVIRAACTVSCSGTTRVVFITSPNDLNYYPSGAGSLAAGTNNIGKTNTQDTDDGSVSGSQVTELNTVLPYGFNPTSGVWTRTIINPCTQGVTASLPISQITSTQIITTPTNKVHFCSILLNAADAENISIVEGTGTVCATSILAIIGATTAANGMNLPIGSGFAHGNGSAVIAKATVNNNNICLLQSGTGRVAGVITYISVP